ncbi:hypothetical protein GCM10017767_04080 [Halomonas urumqiensis]|nr:hypothetical protein GCM10017767_04080 [Halomonas urumqiensis]
MTLLALYLVICLALGIWWSQTPARFAIEQAVLERRGDAAETTAARGAVTIATLAQTLAVLLDKPGGYVRNDIAPPGVWLDNMPSWELGVLNQARDLALALPEMASTSSTGLDDASNRLMGDSDDWFPPATEERLQDALTALDDYQVLLDGQGEGGFAPAAGLSPWLMNVASRLDDLGHRLSASVGSTEALRDLDIDADALPARTPWYRVDNIFFEARGSGWALIQLLEGVRRDQADVLERAGVSDEWRRLIAELELTQRRLWSPVVLNGSGFGVFANHSLVMAHHMIRARESVANIAGRLEGPPPAVASPESALTVAPTEDTDSVSPSVQDVERTEQAVPPPEALEAPEEMAGDDEATVESGGDESASSVTEKQ